MAPSRVYLPHGVGQDLDDLLVRRRHDALTVDLDDAVTDSDAASLGDAASHQAADLHGLRKTRSKVSLEHSRTAAPQPIGDDNSGQRLILQLI